jgi:hypothetical protein
MEVEEGYIEQIGVGSKWFGLKKPMDVLMISNGVPNAWIFNIFTGYKQLGTYKIARPHAFEEGELITVHMKNKKIIGVSKIMEGEEDDS